MEKIIEQLIKDSPILDGLCRNGTTELSGGLFQAALEDFAERLAKIISSNTPVK